MKTKTLFLLFGIVIARGDVGHADGNLAELRRWKGRESFVEIDHRTFWQVPALTEALANVFNPRELDSFDRTRGPETKVEVYKSYVYGSICQAHDCGSHIYHVIVDTASDQVWVCYKTEAQVNAGRVQWVTTGHRRAQAEECEPDVDEQGNASFSARLAQIPASLR